MIRAPDKKDTVRKLDLNNPAEKDVVYEFNQYFP
jgi:hypothetical protein